MCFISFIPNIVFIPIYLKMPYIDVKKRGQ
jgi:hypothetical protein